MGWQTVSQLFDGIESAASDEGDAVVRITAEYDADLDYPRTVSITCRQTIADCDRAFYLRGLSQ